MIDSAPMPRGRPKLDTTLLKEALAEMRETVTRLQAEHASLVVKVTQLEERQAALQYRARQIEGA